VFNVGTGTETNVNELFHTIRDLTGADIPEEHGEAKPGEQQRSVLSYARSKQALGWSPQVDVGEGLARTVDWFKEQEERQEIEDPE
jgi:UDP-glucose 4-epimerase